MKPGAGASTCASAWLEQGLLDGRRRRAASARAWSRRYSRRSVATWSLRERPARSLPPSGAEPLEQRRARARCARPRRPASGRTPRCATSASRSSSAPSIAASSSSSSSPARCSTRACARDAAQVVRRQPPVEVHRQRQRRQRLGGSGREPAAPQPGCRRPIPLPRSARVTGPPRRSRRAAIRLGRPHSCDEALGQRLVEGVAGVVGGQAEVVQRLLAAPARDDRPAAVQRHPDVAGDVLVGVVDEAVQRVA